MQVDLSSTASLLLVQIQVEYQRYLKEHPRLLGKIAKIEVNPSDIYDMIKKNELSIETESVTATPVHEADNELIDIVRNEIEMNIPGLKQAITQIVSTQSSNETKAEAVSSHKSLIERLMLASESIGLAGLTRILGNINDNIELFNPLI